MQNAIALTLGVFAGLLAFGPIGAAVAVCAFIALKVMYHQPKHTSTK